MYMVAGGLLILCGVPAYVILQILATRRLRGEWRKAALFPLIPMFLILIYSMGAYEKGSNLWPILLIFTSPLAALYLLVILCYAD